MAINRRYQLMLDLATLICSTKERSEICMMPTSCCILELSAICLILFYYYRLHRFKVFKHKIYSNTMSTY